MKTCPETLELIRSNFYRNVNKAVKANFRRHVALAEPLVGVFHHPTTHDPNTFTLQFIWDYPDRVPSCWEEMRVEVRLVECLPGDIEMMAGERMTVEAVLDDEWTDGDRICMDDWRHRERHCEPPMASRLIREIAQMAFDKAATSYTEYHLDD